MGVGMMWRLREETMLAREAMTLQALLGDMGRGFARRLGSSFRIRKTPESDSQRDLLRLAELSPHLLEDIGFRRERDGRVYTDGRHRIAVPGPDARDRLLRVGRV
jgi:hypothetical protein